VPVVSRSGEVQGGLFFGHDQPGVFTVETEQLITALAGHAALAIDNARLYQAARRLVAVVEASTDAIVSKDLAGVITSWNKAAEQLFGYSAEEAVGRPITILIPVDRLQEEEHIIGRIRSGQAVTPYETLRRRKDGTLVPVSLSVSPVKDAAGNVIGASKIARDITERRRAEEREKLLTQEIQHRTKNIFAVVQAIVARSFAGKETVREAEQAVLSRLHALAQTHALLIDKDWQGADLRDVVAAELGPYSERVTIEGPSIVLEAKAAQNFALALHELATKPPTRQNTARSQRRTDESRSYGLCRHRMDHPASISSGRNPAGRR
jgi:PAS domain S-box-containing protein